MVKTSLTIALDFETKKKLEKRAKKEMLSLEELMSDILRRSVLSYKGSSSTDNIDDIITFIEDDFPCWQYLIKEVEKRDLKIKELE